MVKCKTKTLPHFLPVSIAKQYNISRPGIKLGTQLDKQGGSTRW